MDNEPKINESDNNSENNDNTGNNGGKEEKKSSLLQDIIDIAESTLITIFVIVLIFTYFLHPVNVVGRSMVPTLNKNYESSASVTDKIFMSTVYFNLSYGDIIIIDQDQNYLLDENGNIYTPTVKNCLDECIIKRIIAVGGQTIDIRDNQVIVDGKVLDEPYIADGSTTVGLGAFDSQYPITIPEGYYFVMGDNRNRSTDSRAPQVGLIKAEQIYGVALMRYSPIKDFKILTDSWKESADE